MRGPRTERSLATRARLDGELAQVTKALEAARDKDSAAYGEYRRAHDAFYGNARERIPPLIPALAYAAPQGYPSLSQQASIDEVRRAAQALFAPDAQNQSIVVRPEEGQELWRVQVVARQSADAAVVAQALARAGELERDHATVREDLLLLEERDPGALRLIAAARSHLLGEAKAAQVSQRQSSGGFSPLAQALGKALNVEAQPEGSPEPAQASPPADVNLMARMRAMSDVKDKLNRIDEELRKMRNILRDKAVSRLVFRGVIARRIRLPAGSRAAPLADGIDLGATVAEGQPVTKVPERAAISPTSKSATGPSAQGAPRIREINVYLRRDVDPDPVAALFAPKRSALPARSVLIRDGVRLSRDEVGSFMLPVGGKPQTVFVTVKSDTPLTVEPTIHMLGGLGNFLEKLGIFSADAVAQMSPGLRASHTIPAAQVQQILDTVFEGDRRMAQWLKGETAANVLFLDTEPPAGAVRGFGAGSGAPATRSLTPLSKTDKNKFGKIMKKGNMMNG